MHNLIVGNGILGYEVINKLLVQLAENCPVGMGGGFVRRLCH